MMWGGGDGSTDINNGRGDTRPSAGEATAGAGMEGVAGAAGAGAMGGRSTSDDEQIYGGASGSGSGASDLPRQPPGGSNEDLEGLEGYREDEGWVGEGQDEVMEDPWEPPQGGDDSGWFGGGGGGGGDGGSWGEWGS